MSKDYASIAVGMYNKGIQKRGMSPEESFENLVSAMHRMQVPLGELRGILGKNAGQLSGFNKAWIGKAGQIYASLEKEPLSSKQVKEIKRALSVLHLRHLQQKDWEEKDNYISYDRLELGAEDYSERNIPMLLIDYFKRYHDVDYSGYRDEINSLYSELKATNPSIEELKSVAESDGFMKVFVESPDRLTTVPDSYKNFTTDKPLKRGGVIRFAPTPNGPLHMGHGRGVSILSDYADKYNMEFLLRFDDTNQDDEKKNSDISQYGIDSVYDHIIEDFTWIRGKAPDKVVYASDRANLDRYENFAKKLIFEDMAYVCFIKDGEYIYGKSRDENISMLNQIINAGESPAFDSAGLLLGIPNGNENVNNIFNLSDEEIRRYSKNFVQEQVYGGQISQNNAQSYMNTETGTKIAGYQKVQNKRVAERGETQWFWPNLSLQSVVDDMEEGVTHIVRGQDYDYEKALAKFSRAKGEAKTEQGKILYTLRFQAILRVLIGAPPVASTGNWGQVAVKNSRYPTSTSKIKKLIIDGEVDSFLDGQLPTIYSLRSDSNNWGPAFRFYWTRFDLPNDLDPSFDIAQYKTLNEEIKENFTNPADFIRFNRAIIADISNLQERGLYLAEDY